MGTKSCCSAHLAAMARDFAPDAQNGSVTVKPAENSFERFVPPRDGGYVCHYCGAPAEFDVSWHPKPE